ncbi:hypothetical protein [Brevundimonas sp. UBA7534]|uniref:hypothetical protein n=1 Tax=Brevundimonas sp. UBA7534 TaxID=1946138 RepID=UPI0025C02E9E|nr:hypothetical protein [Brevundimonas sp. UBA7534]
MASRPDRLNVWLASPRLRWGLGGLAIVAIGAATVAMTARPRPATAEIDDALIQIRLVAPTEPEVEPGEIMDVGRLRDDFDRAVLIRAEAARRAERAAAAAALAYHDEDYGDDYVDDRDAPPVRMIRSDGWGPVVTLPAPPRRPVEREPAFVGSPTAYGFDAPRPDYAAERRARREAWEARAAQDTAERRVRAYADTRY